MVQDASGLLDAHRVILGLDSKEWDLDVKHRIGGSGIAIISTLRGIAPKGALQGPDSSEISEAQEAYSW